MSEIAEVTELDEELHDIFHALQAAKKAYSKCLEEKGTDEAYYPLRLIAYKTDDEFNATKKAIEIDDREISKEEPE